MNYRRVTCNTSHSRSQSIQPHQLQLSSICNRRPFRRYLGKASEFSGLSHLEILNKGTQRIHPSGENSSDRSNTIRMLFQTQNGNIYMANRMGSLYEYNSALTKVIRQEDFTHNVYSMNEDQEGNLWLGMRGSAFASGANKWYKNDPQKR